VTPGYFSAMSLVVRRGRPLGPTDGPTGPRVAVINETMARRFWPNENPIGKRVALSVESLRFTRPNAPPTLDFEGSAREIVGVVADVRASAIADPALPALYIPFAQRPVTDLTLTVRTSGDPLRLVGPVRAAVRALDPDQPVSSVAAMSDIVAASVKQPRDRTTLIGVFAAVALVLAAVGVYGVMAYSVTQRRREIGVRLALGARPRQVARLVLGQALSWSAVGCALGVTGSLLAGRAVSGLLFGIAPNDGWTLIAVSVVMGAISFVASWIPASRAARVDPVVVLSGG